MGDTICKSIDDAVQQSLEDDILVALGLEELSRACRSLGLASNGLFLALCFLLQLQPLDLGILSGNVLLLLVGDLEGGKGKSRFLIAGGYRVGTFLSL
jgi:hypothetical protein